MQRPQPETVTLDDVAITEDLSRRSPRPPNLQAENQALHTLARQMVTQPETMLQSLVDIAIDLCYAGTAGVSLLDTTPDGEEVFRWKVLAGALAQYVGGTIPRNFSPCGVCLDRGTPQLYEYPERYFTYFQTANTPIVECLVLPLIADNHALGTIWITSHDRQRHFDPEDVRVMTSLADFTAAALLLNQRQTQQLLAKNVQLEAEVVERKRSQAVLEQPNHSLQLLSDISMQLLAQPQPEALLPTLLDQIASLLNLEFYFNYLVTDDRASLRLNASLGVDEATRTSLQRLEFGQAVCGTVAQSEQTIVVNGAQSSDHPCCEQIRSLGINAYLCYPLMAENIPIGTLSFGRRTGECFQPEEITLMRAIADQVVMALHRTRLMADLRNEVKERRRAEESSRESEVYFRAIADLVPDLLWRNDVEGKAIWYNQRWLSYTGQTLEEAQGNGWVETIHPDDRAQSFANFHKAVQECRPLRQEYRIKGTDGNYRWFLVQARPAIEPDGRIIWFGAATNIHEQRMALEALQESKRRLQERTAMLERAQRVGGMGHWTYDVATRELFWSREARRIFVGECEFELSYQAAANLVHPEDLLNLQAATDAAIAQLRPLEVQYRIIRPDGVERTVYLSADLDFDAGGHPIKMFGIVQDITEAKHREAERQQAAAALREAEEQYRFQLEQEVHKRTAELENSKQTIQQMLNGSVAGVSVLESKRDEQGKIVDFIYQGGNKAAERVLNRSIEDMVGKQLLQLWPGVKEIFFDTCVKVVETGEPFQVEHQYPYDGFDHWFDISGVKNGDGFIMTFHDITAQKRAEQEAIRVKDELAQRATYKYRKLFSSMDEGYFLCDVIFDENDQPIDIFYVDANPSATRMVGQDFTGRRLREINRNYEAYWYEICGRVARTGKGERLEQYAEPDKKWYDFYVFKVGDENSRQVAVVFNDITARKQREANAAFLAEIAADFSRLSTADEIMHAVGTKVGTYLNISNCLFAEINEAQNQAIVEYTWHTADTPDVTGVYRLSEFVTEEFQQAARSGETIIIRNTQTDPRTDKDGYAAFKIHAFVTVPFHRGGEWKYLFTVNDSAARDWREDEIDLIREVTNRSFPRLERARAEAAVRESEEKYRSLFESMDEGYILVDMIFDQNEQPIDALYIDANPAAVRMTGTELVGRRTSELDPNYASQWFEIFGRVAKTGIGERHELYTAGLDVWYSFYVFKVGELDSRQVAAVYQDITERKRAEQTLRESEERQVFLLKLSDALQRLDDPIAIQAQACRLLGEHLQVNRVTYADIDGDVLIAIRGGYVNGVAPMPQGRSSLVPFGDDFLKAYHRGEAIAIHDVFTDPLFTPADRERYKAMQIAAFASVPLIKGGCWEGGFTLYQAIPRIWTDLELQLLHEVADRIWAATERARAEDALRESEIQRIREQAAREEERQRAETLAELDRAKTLFFSNFSHEFRTPLTLLLAPLQDALSDRTHPLAPPQRERLELAHRNSLRLLKLVNTLLDFSRIEAGRMEAVYEPTDLAMFTTELASVFRSAIERAGLRLIVDCPPLPEPVYVDREMWEKIVLNLLSNAFKFTLKGEIRVSLKLRAEDQVSRGSGENVHSNSPLHTCSPAHLHTCPSASLSCIILEVRDTGTGIAPEHLPHLFKRFYQVRGVKARTPEGSGIGLALVHELIRLHGGTIEVSSTVGQGSCFKIALPLGTAHLPSDRLRLDVGDRITATRTLASTAVGAAPYVEEAERWLPEEGERGKGKGKRGKGKGKRGNSPLGWKKENGQREKENTPTKDPTLSPFPLLPSPSPPARVLLVDDNADMREYLTRILSQQVQVEAVADGASALAAAQERVPDLVLTDVMMPGIDGFELLKALRADPRTREVPIILLSARAGEESVVEGLQAGADDYLIKPFSAQQLLSRVNGHLQMAQMRLEALHHERTINRRKDELLSTVSHELNTPLVAILGWTRLLRANPSNQSMLIKSLETIERNAMLQAKLIQDLLDISRINAGKLRLSLAPVELKSAIEIAIATVAQTAQTKGIKLYWRQTTGLPDADPVVVMGDRDRLQQVICNLLTNAIKFTPEGGSVIVELSTIKGEKFSDDCYAEICVMDTGIGISAEFLPHVFERFRQAEQSGSAKGLGLGLAIARHLVELHNGSIYAESAGVGQGSTFIVKLPLLEKDENL